MSTHTVTDAATGAVIQMWDDATRTYTDFRPDPDETRPYNAEENARADDAVAAAEHAATEDRVRAIIDDLKAEKDRMQLVMDTDNTIINDSPAKYVKDTAQSAKRIADAAIDLAKYVDGK